MSDVSREEFEALKDVVEALAARLDFLEPEASADRIAGALERMKVRLREIRRGE